MDTQRLLVWAVFGLMALWTYEAWMRDYGPQPQPAITTPAGETAAEQGGDAALPELAAPDDGELPALPPASQAANGSAAGGAQADAPATEAAVPTIRILTDVLELEISARGGTLQHARLLNYPVTKDNPDEVVQLLAKGREERGLIHAALRSRGGAAEPNQLAVFSAPATSYELQGDELIIPLTWTDGQGITVTKTYRLRRGSYRIDVEQTVTNGSDQSWQGAEYAQIERRFFSPDRSMFDVESYSFDGPVVYDGDKSTKISRDDLLDDGPYRLSGVRDGWLATIQHHFLTAAIPPDEGQYSYNVSTRNNVLKASFIGPAVDVAPGSQHSFTTTLFVGPKLQAQLEEIDESLKLTVDYGILTILSNPLFWLLSLVYGFVENWGVAIIVVTILIKLLFYKLTETSGRSMAKMRKLQPRMKALQERYKDDRQQLSQQMMDLYRREKVNPAAGCLPILVQMPFFLAFYWVLLESVEMRQAPFALWITDLSSRDPYFILPVIMGAAMLFQTKLNPAPADPVQARVMQVMPLIFTAMFAFFPSGLVLYWVTNTILSIAQQWHINRAVEAEDKQKAAARASKPKKKDKDG